MTRLLGILALIGLVTSTAAHGADAVPDVRVRYGEHENFSRMVFDWPEAVPYTATLDDGMLSLDFKSSAKIDLSALRNDPPDFIKIAGVTPGADDVKVGFDITRAAKLRHFRDGPRV